MIVFDDFKKVELRVATVQSAEAVPDSEKLVRLAVRIGEEERQIVAGIRKAYAPEALIGRQIVVITNLEPRMLKGLESQGMLLAAHDTDGAPVLLVPDREVPPGSEVS